MTNEAKVMMIDAIMALCKASGIDFNDSDAVLNEINDCVAATKLKLVYEEWIDERL